MSTFYIQNFIIIGTLELNIWLRVFTLHGVSDCFQGKVEMELEILTEAEAEEKPAGRARDDPNQHPVLDPPK